MPAGRALWLIPDEAARTRLSAVIDRLADAHRTPRFDPHVTLLAGIMLEGDDLGRRARALAERTPALPVTLTCVSGLPEYYRALFLDVRSDGLGALHTRAAAAMGRPADPAFRPHLSLMYALLTPASRDAILAEIGRTWDLSCVLDRLDVVRVEGPPNVWMLEERVPLSPP
jgi:2'-5' RNA ligase